MIVDFHTHIFSSDLIKQRNRYIDDKNYSFLYSDEKAKLIDHNIMLRAMDDSGIDHVVIMGFPWENEKYCQEQNQYFKDVFVLSKGRIIPFASVPLSINTNIEEWVKGIKDLGLFGIGEIAFYSDGMNKTNSAILRKIFESAQIYSLPVCLHLNEPVGHDYPGKYEPDLNVIYSILKDFPELTVVLAHWGGGILFYEMMPEVREAFRNVYYDIAASPFLYSNDIYDVAIKILGSEKILFGSDYPLIRFERYLTDIEKNVKDEKHRKNIIGENARRILKL
ncbi:MAG: TatD family hydrolase [Spirochaetota bacterium]|nr:TatD family hydrolase [Spirochaetota bacterium]